MAGGLVLVAIISCAVYTCTGPKSNTHAPIAAGQARTPQLVVNSEYNGGTESQQRVTRNVLDAPVPNAHGQQGPGPEPEYHDFAGNPVAHGCGASKAPRHYDLEEAKSPKHYDLEEAAKVKAKSTRPYDLEEPTTNAYVVGPPKALSVYDLEQAPDANFYDVDFAPGSPGACALGVPKEPIINAYDLGAPDMDEAAGVGIGLAIETGLPDDSMSEEEI